MEAATGATGATTREAGGNDAPSRLEVERYVESITGVIERIGTIEERLLEMGEEGWPTKMRGNPQDRLVELDSLAEDAAREARAVAPANERLSALHSHLRGAADAYRRVASAGAREEGFDGAEQLRALISAQQEAGGETRTWVAELREIAGEREVDLSPIVVALQSTERDLGGRIKAFAMRLLRPFMPIVPVTFRRLLVVPFMPPYGPLSPPRIAAAAGWCLDHIPWQFGLIAAVLVLATGLWLTTAYYMMLGTWWIFAGWWISLIMTVIARR